MADNLTTTTTVSTVPSGTVIATDDAGAGGHVQIVKLAISTDGSATAIPAEATNGLDVDVTRVIPGTSATHLGKAEDAAHTTADTGVAVLAVRRDSAAVGSDTDGDYSTLNVNASGRLYTTTAVDTALPAGTNNIGDVDVLSVPADPFGANADAAATAGSTGSIQAKLRLMTSQLDAIKTAVETLDNVVGGSEAQVDIVGALPAGTNAIGKLAANSGVDIGDVDVTSISAGSNLIGDVGIQGRATGGLSIFRSIDLDESEEEVKATAGTLYSVYAFNATAAVLYLKFYNATAANVTVGTTTPVLTLPIPANNDTDGAGFVWSVPQGLAFDTAISAAVTTGVADNDTGAPAANAAIVNLGYK